MEKDAGIPLTLIRVDGGVTHSNVAMQLQSDLVGIPLRRPAMTESTCYGAALAAAIGTGVLSMSPQGVPVVPAPTWAIDTFEPTLSNEERDKRYVWWQKAVDKARGWQCTQSD